MATAALIAHRRRSREHIESLVSVEKATHLQGVSMKKFQIESSHDLKLGRMIGHVSVNRRSTEIIKTATFEEEVLREMMDEDMFGCDEDTAWVNVGAPHTASERQTAIPNVPVVQEVTPLVESPLAVDQLVAIYDSQLNALTRYQPESTKVPTIHANEEFLLAMGEDWMYDVLDLNIDFTSLIQPQPSARLSNHVAVQLRQIIETLSGLAKRDSQARIMDDVRTLEAYGFAEQDKLFGLGLHCNPAQFNQHNSRAQLVA